MSDSKEITIQGEGLFDLVLSLFKRKSGLLPPKARKLLEMVKDEKVKSLKVVRTPLSSVLSTLLNIVSFGAFQRQLKRLGYDRAFHLALYINDNYSLDKQQVIKFEPSSPIKKGSEIVSVDLKGKDFTIGEMIAKTKALMGDKKFSNYDMKSNNCQDFVMAVLESNGVSSPDLERFVKQDAVSIVAGMPKFVQKFGKRLTDMAAVANRFIEGTSINNNKKKSFLNKNTDMKKSLQDETTEGGFLQFLAPLAVPLLSNLLSGRGVEIKKSDEKKIKGGFLPLHLMMGLLGSGVDPKTKIKVEDFEKILQLGKGVPEETPRPVDVKMEKLMKKLKGGSVKTRKPKKEKTDTTPKPKRAPSKWLLALKEWNSKTGKPYIVPKKGTKEYDAVKKLSDKM